MGLITKKKEEAALSASKLSCIHCGAGVDKLTLDAEIIVTFRINDAGEIDRAKPVTEKDLLNRAIEEGPKYKTMFCDECGHYMSIIYSDDCKIVGFKKFNKIKN